MCTKWLANTHSKLPNFASTFLGVGGFVVNDKNEVLMVKEKNGPIKNIWKLPGGAVDPGEDLCHAAVREVFEETGIETEFDRIVCFRHSHSAPFQKSDIYFLCKLKPLTSEIKIQEDEIAEAQWIPLETFSKLPFYKGLYKEMNLSALKSMQDESCGLKPSFLPVFYSKKNECLYHSKL
eukprot:TRINITY_DN430_c0_g1_i2.p1 TRINITY_DN430_c0_g1~~TRINITY_DN430_c0_g1_i2.p1  ORF type:complete len:179 (-),score=38.28 TRINITY_DN430_c0_g1_i2:49-585(-)